MRGSKCEGRGTEGSELEVHCLYNPSHKLRSLSSFSDLFEERALLLSRLGRHEVALAIYAHVLKEPEMAEE